MHTQILLERLAVWYKIVGCYKKIKIKKKLASRANYTSQPRNDAEDFLTHTRRSLSLQISIYPLRWFIFFYVNYKLAEITFFIQHPHWFAEKSILFLFCWYHQYDFDDLLVQSTDCEFRVRNLLSQAPSKFRPFLLMNFQVCGRPLDCDKVKPV